MKKYFKGWTKFEKTFFLIGSLLLLFSGIFFNCGFLETIVPFIGFFSALHQAKGLVLGQLTGLIMSILYSIMSFNNHYYGEIIVYTLVILPLYISGIYTWLKNKDNKTKKVKQYNIKKNEWITLLIINTILFIVLYFVLKFFNTSNLLVSTLSMNINLTATYLLVRRSKYCFIFYLINAIILLILWGIPVLKGEIIYLPMTINALLLLSNNTYGLYSWSKK